MEPVECRRCHGSGEVAISATTGRFVAAGPVPDDAKGVAEALDQMAEAIRKIRFELALGCYHRHDESEGHVEMLSAAIRAAGYEVK
ncbi:MAG: hypothetical protein RBR34_08400 [Rhodospirillaceae bacterium]|nr:hypothetical protein [Rhodospirillaceae bacterium]